MTARIQKPLPARPCPPFTSPNRRANRPAEGFTLAPYWVYSDRDLYAREQAAIFRGKSCHYVGLEAEVPETGSYKTSYVGELPVVLTRAEDGSLHVLLKRCTCC